MLPDCSVDAILTDPPYELGFMGHAWDRSGIAYDVAMWREALRVLKPGGHMLAFSGSRTYHRMTCAIEDAGFEVRDSIMWVYGSGFPKSLDISKAIDKIFGAERQVIGRRGGGATSMHCGVDGAYGFNAEFDITAPATLAAQIWEGWGTGLKPAHEPICVARKPMAADTVAANILAHGVGGINIDGCRVPIDPVADASQLRTMSVSQHDGAGGRWPANVIHDGSPEVLALFPETAPSKSGTRNQAARETQASKGTEKARIGGKFGHDDNGGSAARFYQQCQWTQDDLEAALFYYCAKASKRDRDEGLELFETKRVGAIFDSANTSMLTGSGNPRTTARANNHPTVKPTALMRYLSRLICPSGGTILDIFAGSGSTGKAAILEGFQFLGFELEAEFTDLANARIEHARIARG